MSALGVAAAFKNICEPNQVGVDIGIGIDRRIRDTGLSGKVDNVSEVLTREQACDGAAIGALLIRAKSKNLRRACAQHEASTIGPGRREAS